MSVTRRDTFRHVLETSQQRTCTMHPAMYRRRHVTLDFENCHCHAYVTRASAQALLAVFECPSMTLQSRLGDIFFESAQVFFALSACC